MRALEMLKASRLPNNMSLMEEKKMLEMERNEVFMAEMERLHREMNDKQLQLERLRKNHDVPDHDEAYRSFTVQLERHKAANRKNTRTVPFTLRSGSRSRCRDDCAAKVNIFGKILFLEKIKKIIIFLLKGPRVG